MYEVHSVYPPTLWKNLKNEVRVVGGTVYKLIWNGISLAVDQPLPHTVTLENLTWVPMRVIPKAAQLQTYTVAGSKGAVYTVTILPTGKRSCTCPGYNFRRTCKHIAG